MRPPSAPSRPGVERERRQDARLFAQRVEPRRDIGAVARARRFAAALPVPGQLEQLVFIEPDERALQHRRQREIVLRQQQGIGERHQVHHRDVLRQHQPVGAGHGHVLVFQRPDDGLKQHAAPPHQDQHLLGEPALASPQRHVLGDALGELHHAAGAPLHVERRVPRLDIVARVGRHRLPEFDQARRRLRQGLVHRASASAVNPA